MFSFIVLTSLVLGTSVFVMAQEETPEEKRVRWDQGPQTIDVSNYPPEMQKNYNLFAQKCSSCHNLARPVNAEFKIPDWERYTKRMLRKPGSGISPQDAKKIFEFLKYDTQVRKPELAKQ